MVQIGSSDRQRSFHPFGIGIISAEETEDYAFIFQSLKNLVTTFTPRVLLADPAEEIIYGYEQVYGKPVYRIYYWIHMERNFKKNLASKEIGTSKKIIGPII